MKYLLLDNAVKQGFILEGFKLKEFNEKVNELENFNKLCKLVPIVYTSEYDNKLHFEHVEVLIEFKGMLLKPYKRYNEKSFKFYLVESLHVQGFEHDLKEPSKVGTPTEKKLNDWLDYLLNIESLKTDVLAQRNNKEKVFFDKIKNSGLEVTHQSNNGKRGYIQTENFEFGFEVENDGHIRQRITLRCGNTIDDFLKLVKISAKKD